MSTETQPTVTVDSPEWLALNGRRIDLIEKKFRDGLTDEERTELEAVRERCRAALSAAFPRPPLLDPETRAFLERAVSRAPADG